MRNFLNMINKGYELAYLLNKSISMMNNYQTDTTKYQIFDLIVKKIKNNNESMSDWIGYLCNSLLEITQGETIQEQKKILKFCILNEIETCSFSQEYLSEYHTRDELIKISEITNDANDIDATIQRNVIAYVLSQGTLFTLEFLYFTEYQDSDIEWAYYFSFLSEQWVQSSVNMILAQDQAAKIIYGETIKLLQQHKTEFRNSLTRGDVLQFNPGVIERYNKPSEENGKIRPGIIHCLMPKS